MAEFTGVIDIVIKIVGVTAIIIGVLQLMEVRRRRSVDMFWKISETYSSTEQQDARKHVQKAEASLSRFAEYKKEGKLTDPTIQTELAKTYKTEFHDADEGQPNRESATFIRKRLHFLHQCGVLLKQNMIHEDLLFGLIGPGLDIDEPLLTIALTGHRMAHHYPSMFYRYDWLVKEHNRYKANNEIQSTSVVGG